MKTTAVIWTILLVLRVPVFASGNDTDIQVQYPCVGLDGVPLTSGALERQCCVNGKLIANAPPTCRAGFNSLLGDAVGGVAFNLNVANDTLAVARDLNGVNLNTGTGNRNLTGSGSGGGANTTASLSGLVASGGSGFGLGAGDGAQNGINDAMGGRGSQSGLGTGGAAGGAGGGVGAFGGDGAGGSGFSVGKGKANSDSEGKTGDSAVSGGFRSGSGGDGADAMNGGWLNEGGSGGEVQGGEGLEEVALGDEGLQEDDSGQVEGTVVDPSNYFSLIHPKDNLFKIVSRRYTKKWPKMKISAGADRGSRVPASKAPKFTPF